MNLSDISRENLIHFLKDGEFRTENYWRYLIDGSFPEQTTSCRDENSHICPFQGFISESIPGCLIHPLYPLRSGEEERKMSLFSAETCNNYHCPAYTLLSDDMKRIIIENIDDWYYYTIAIIDPLSTIWIIEEMLKVDLKTGHKSFKNTLNSSLKIYGAALNKHEKTIFCYSMEEYNLERREFSLSADNKKIENERNQILQLIKNNKII